MQVRLKEYSIVLCLCFRVALEDPVAQRNYCRVDVTIFVDFDDADHVVRCRSWRIYMYIFLFLFLLLFADKKDFLQIRSYHRIIQVQSRLKGTHRVVKFLQPSSFEDYGAAQRELLESIAEQSVRSRSLRISFDVVVVVLTRSVPLVWTSAFCRCKVGPKETHRVCVWGVRNRTGLQRISRSNK